MVTGFCTCTAGHSRCFNYIVLVLYTLHYGNEKGYTNPVFTDEIYNWNSSSKEIHSIKVEDMEILQNNLGNLKQKYFLKHAKKP